MLYFIIKCGLSGIIIAIVSEVAKRSPAFGALIVSLPLVSLLGIVWLWRDTGDAQRIADHAESTFWFVLPSLPMFLVLPAMLRADIGIGPSLVACCLMTVALYFFTTWALAKFGGINL
jgi:cobalamin synthase